MKHLAVGLVQVNQQIARNTRDVCKKLMSKFKKASSKIHHRVFVSSNETTESKSASHHHFSGIITNKDVNIELSELPYEKDPTTKEMTGKTLKISYSNTDPYFIPFKNDNEITNNNPINIDEVGNNIDEDDHDDVLGGSFVSLLHSCILEVYQGDI